MSALIQRSPEWHAIRRTKIGGSDAAAIMGVSPHKTIQQLYDEKLNGIINFQPNAAMQRGIDLEPVALSAFNKDYCVNCKPYVVFPEEHPWMMASLDGWDEESKSILEIKCPGERNYSRCKAFDVPDEYIAQFQHILAAMSLESMFFMAYRGEDDYVVSRIIRDEKYISNLLEREKQFWDALQDITIPLPLTGFPPIDTDRWIALEHRWIDLKAQEAAIKAEMDDVRAALVDESRSSNVRGPLLSLQKVRMPGRIDYKAVPEIQKMDLEQYRKEETWIWRVDSRKN